MKAKYHLVRLITTAGYLISSLLGAAVGVKVFREYAVVFNGIVGLELFYLIYQAFMSPGINEDINASLLLEAPKARYFLFMFFWTLIMYWAFRQISTMILAFF